MRYLKRLGMLGLVATIFSACEDITNPVEEFGQLVDPYIRFENATAIGAPGSIVNVIVQMPTRVEEDVDYTFGFGGSAVFGEDFIVVDRQGNPRTDVSAAGGSGRINYRFNTTSFLRDTIRVFVPFNATDARQVQVELTGAQTVTGRNLETGYIDRFGNFTLSIEGFVDIPEGTYVGTRTGDFGSSEVSVQVEKLATPVTIGGVDYRYEIADYSGDGGIFGVGVPWVFNVTSGGNVIAASVSHVFGTVTSDVDGTFSFASGSLDLDIELTCCGAAGFGWSLFLTHQ